MTAHLTCFIFVVCMCVCLCVRVLERTWDFKGLRRKRASAALLASKAGFKVRLSSLRLFLDLEFYRAFAEVIQNRDYTPKIISWLTERLRHCESPHILHWAADRIISPHNASCAPFYLVLFAIAVTRNTLLQTNIKQTVISTMDQKWSPNMK